MACVRQAYYYVDWNCPGHDTLFNWTLQSHRTALANQMICFLFAGLFLLLNSSETLIEVSIKSLEMETFVEKEIGHDTCKERWLTWTECNIRRSEEKERHGVH